MESEVDITEKVKALLGEQVKYAAVRGIIDKRIDTQDPLIVDTQKGIVLNTDWDCEMYIVFNNGGEIVVAGSDYVSVIVRNECANRGHVFYGKEDRNF